MKRFAAEALSRLKRYRLVKTAASVLAGDADSAPPALPRHLGPALDGLRVLLLGTCGVELLARSTEGFGLTVDHMLMASFSYTETPDVAQTPRDIAIVALTLRNILSEAAGGSNIAADLLFARELQKRSAAGGWGVASLAAHPGVSQSELIVNGMGRATVQGRLAARMTSLIWQPTARGALPSLFAATAPDAIPGGYYGPDGVMEIGGAPAPAHVSRAGRDAAAAKRLWEACTALTGAVWPASSGQPSPDRTPT